MHIQKDFSLKPFNTFGISEIAHQFVELRSEEELPEIGSATQFYGNVKVLGGGSNILLTEPVSGFVVRNCLSGISVLEENETHVWLQVKAGENWHNLVMFCVNQNLGGIENLALIPGCVGAAPMQNIGAYGVEVKNCVDTVTAWHWEEQKFISLRKEECNFGYRDSIFKRELKDKVLITSVTFRLDKIHCINTSYLGLQQRLEDMGVSEPSIKNVAEAVISIRKEKLPDPDKIGNAGSFFKNPVIAKSHLHELQQHYPTMPFFPFSENEIKVPAGWLIEHCGWKGFREGDAGVHPKQALVLVNYANAKGSDIWNLSEKILASVQEKFGILLEREVNVW